MTPDDEFDELVEHLDDVAEAAVEQAEQDLDADLAPLLVEVLELIRFAESELAAGRPFNPPWYIRELLNDIG